MCLLLMIFLFLLLLMFSLLLFPETKFGENLVRNSLNISLCFVVVVDVYAVFVVDEFLAFKKIA